MDESFIMVAKFVLVTGSTGGLGQGISRELAMAGYNVALHFNRREEEAKTLGRAIRESGTEAQAFKEDLSTEHGPKKLAESIKNCGIDLCGMVNNSGIGGGGKIRDISEEDWDSSLKLNLRAPVMLVRYLHTSLTDNSSIVNVASSAGIKAGAVSIAYEASKAGLIHVTKSMAVELAPRIRVNAIAPGFVRTNMTSRFLDVPSVLEPILKRTPLGRLGTPDDIGSLTAFLISDKSSYITGQTIAIDGGITLS